jgi:hypothetical protein
MNLLQGALRRAAGLAAAAVALAALPGAVGAPLVHSDRPAGPPRTVSLEELWRIGGDGDEHIFGLMIEARCDEAGNVYLLDQQLSRVTVVSSAGEFLADLGGEGDGPGECRMPQTMALFADGSVGLGQRFPGRFVRVTRTGEPLPSLEIGGPKVAARGGFTMLVSARQRGGTLLAATMHQVPGETGMQRDSYLNVLAADGSELARLAAHATYLDFQKAHFVERDMVAPFFGAHTVGPDGLVYLTPERNAYRIDVVRPDGTPVRTITRAFDNPRRDQQTLDRIDALFAEQDRALPFRITWEVDPCDPAIGELIVAGDGRLLVAHAASGRDLPDGVLTRYDVFDPSGLWSHDLLVRCQADRAHDGLIWLDDGRVLLVRGLQLARLTASGNGGQVTDEADGAWAIEVICCRVTPEA